ncbi:cytochrome c biogenesis protein CcdA [soil metagenome]
MADLGDWFGTTAFSGSMLLAVPIAVIAGLVSFFSPCVMPLLPGYLSYVSGLSGVDLEQARRGRMLAGTSLFVLGFSAVFVSYGVLFGSIGLELLRYQRELNVVLGLLTIVVGLIFMGLVPFGQRDLRVHAVPNVGVAAAPLIGIMFGVGWTPCLGPTLTAVLSLSMSEASPARGSLLTLAYTLGLGLPFVVAALAYRRMLGALAWVKRHHVAVSRVGGGLMLLIGVLLVSGVWQLLVNQLQQWTVGYTVVV